MRLRFQMLATIVVSLSASLLNADLVHQWTFNGNAVDLVGEAHGMLSGGAEIQGDRLYLDGQQGSRMLTRALGNALSAKTLVAWVSVDDVTESTRGSALTVENNANGDVFDAIVYGEAVPQRWMAGSNFFLRTQNPQLYGTEETVGEPGEVMLSIVYGADNSITLYRDGAEYGRYTKGSLESFGPDSVVQIGPRHGNHADVFAGFVNEARIYGAALSPEEIGTVFVNGPLTTANPDPPPPPPPVMVHQWSFDGTADDQVGTAHGALANGAALTDDGRLALSAADGQYFRSAPISESITEKTLVAWVSLLDLDEPLAGSVLTIENPQGADTFDAIVYAERAPRQWMAGSNGFQRTPDADNGGDEESVADPGEVMIAVSYDALGTITIYRDGETYATYETSSPPQYLAGIADVLIGPRHEDVINAGGPGNFIDGLINEARIYSGVLSLEDIRAIFATGLGDTGDFDGNGRVAAADMDLLSVEVRSGQNRGKFDLTSDGQVTEADRREWIEGIKHSYFGDSNLDGEFNSADFVAVFQTGQYEDLISDNSTWATGDWDGDREFTSSDFVIAFQSGGYEVGPRAAQIAVPEPSAAALLLLGAVVTVWRMRTAGIQIGSSCTTAGVSR